MWETNTRYRTRTFKISGPISCICFSHLYLKKENTLFVLSWCAIIGVVMSRVLMNSFCFSESTSKTCVIKWGFFKKFGIPDTGIPSTGRNLSSGPFLWFHRDSKPNLSFYYSRMKKSESQGKKCHVIHSETGHVTQTVQLTSVTSTVNIVICTDMIHNIHTWNVMCHFESRYDPGV